MEANQKRLLLSKRISAVYRFTLARVAISFISRVVAQSNYNCLRTGEGVIEFTLLLDWFI